MIEQLGSLKTNLMTPTRILIAICTCKRPAMLRSCLDSIIAQQIPENWLLALAVIENDSVSRSQPIVENVARKASVPVFYRLETRQGIPYARNCAIDEALRWQSDWLIFIDDDEVADKTWLLSCAIAISRYAAEVIHGKVIYRLPEADRWAHLLERNANSDLRAEGKKARSAATNNVLISSRLFEPSGMNLRFDTAFQFSGCSDTEFFNRARIGGATIIYSALPIVYETVPIERCTVKKLFQREARTTAALVCIDASHYGKAAAMRKHLRRAVTNLFQSLGYFLQFAGCLLVRPRKARKHLLVSLLRFGRFYGRILGLSGRMMSPYKTIDSIS